MTEAEWLACDDPDRMVAFLRGKASERKLQLFVCACCRCIWDLLDVTTHGAVEVGERFVDGLATTTERHDAYVALMVAGGAERAGGSADYFMEWAPSPLVAAAIACSDGTESLASNLSGRYQTGLGAGGDGIYRARAMREYLVGARWRAHSDQRQLMLESFGRIRQTFHAIIDRWRPGNTWVDLAEAVWRQQVCMMRDIFGPYPQRFAEFDRRWCSEIAAKIAEGVYADRNFSLLPILADALEDAGCANVDILNHCRQPEVHVRGCWVVDLVLGKE